MKKGGVRWKKRGDTFVNELRKVVNILTVNMWGPSKLNPYANFTDPIPMHAYAMT